MGTVTPKCKQVKMGCINSQMCVHSVYMGTNAREVGPMTEAVAGELRAALARKKLSMREFARTSGLPLTTLQRTLSGKRAIDVDQLFEICDWLQIDAGEVIEAAEKIARSDLDDGLTDYERFDVDPAEHVGASREDFDLVANESIEENPVDTDADYDNA